VEAADWVEAADLLEVTERRLDASAEDPSSLLEAADLLDDCRLYDEALE